MQKPRKTIKISHFKRVSTIRSSFRPVAVAQAIQEPLFEPIFLERFFEGCGSWSSVLSFSVHSRYQELQTNILPWTSIPHISSQISLRPICEPGDKESVSCACQRGGTLTVAGWRRGNRGKVPGFVAAALPGSLVLPRCPKISAAKGYVFHPVVYFYLIYHIYLNHKAAYPKPYPRNCP